ncbi:hypothetical protein THRCLA_21700 [Thraustotheca clavata]|uniref:Uncharacterized protein n=1 Tax=Thraustotheca clavata TaxID=74557 RepID=A0A1V9ZQP0_9STRA|nr:hypothetical protein THRCLA_21700 [Thraustotheca clavata]
MPLTMENWHWECPGTLESYIRLLTIIGLVLILQLVSYLRWVLRLHAYLMAVIWWHLGNFSLSLTLNSGKSEQYNVCAGAGVGG